MFHRTTGLSGAWKWRRLSPSAVSSGEASLEPTGVERQLAVILAANLEGYSRLMGAEEEATLKTLGAYRQIIDGPIARHDGRIFGTGGDSVLATA